MHKYDLPHRSERISGQLPQAQVESQEVHVAFQALQTHATFLNEHKFHKIPKVYMAKSGNPDTMYLHQALKEPNKDKFIPVMQKEVQMHKDKGHWEVVCKDKLPKGTPVLPAVWSMKRKRFPDTDKVYKYKAHLNVGRHKQEKYVNFWETYSPVVQWSTICLFLTWAVLLGWKSQQIDFILASLQVEIKCNMYMEIPKGF